MWISVKRNIMQAPIDPPNKNKVTNLYAIEKNTLNPDMLSIETLFILNTQLFCKLWYTVLSYSNNIIQFNIQAHMQRTFKLTFAATFWRIVRRACLLFPPWCLRSISTPPTLSLPHAHCSSSHCLTLTASLSPPHSCCSSSHQSSRHWDTAFRRGDHTFNPF